MKLLDPKLKNVSLLKLLIADGTQPVNELNRVDNTFSELNPLIVNGIEPVKQFVVIVSNVRRERFPISDGREL